MDKIPAVINAAGKLTALGGSAQSGTVAGAQSDAAAQHVDLMKLRQMAGEYIAGLTGAEAACVTTGAAAGITISIAALITGSDLDKVQRLPLVETDQRFILQAGHAVNFGASIEQMIRLGGGSPHIVGDWHSVPDKLLRDALEEDCECTGFLYVQSHHCAQANMIPLDRCISLCHEHKVPVIVDAAAEEDLTRYIASGADLVTYSGGKAFSGPTVGFIAGRKDLIRNCELQFRGIARTMKVGKEQIMGLCQALDEYLLMNIEERKETLEQCNRAMIDELGDIGIYEVKLKADEAGRDFTRVAVSVKDGTFTLKDLVRFLAGGDPSIRTRNHHLDDGMILIDPRELKDSDPGKIIHRFKQFAEQL
jgi:D-glucosaminate-6-phosphate ammonia-lyase